MLRCLRIACTATALITAAIGAKAADYSAEAAATKAYYLKALPIYKQLGPDAAAKDFNTPKKWFLDQYSLHITITLNDSSAIADSGFPELIGQKWDDVDDLDGKPLGPTVAKAVEKSPDGAAVQLRFAVPNSPHAGHAEGYCSQADQAHILCAWSEVIEQ